MLPTHVPQNLQTHCPHHDLERVDKLLRLAGDINHAHWLTKRDFICNDQGMIHLFFKNRDTAKGIPNVDCSIFGFDDAVCMYVRNGQVTTVSDMAITN